MTPKRLLAAALILGLTSRVSAARAQDEPDAEDDDTPLAEPEAAPGEPLEDDTAEPAPLPPPDEDPFAGAPAEPASLPEDAALEVEQPERMSEGRMLVSLYNSGFQWGIAPGVVFVSGKAGFFLGLRFGYGIDTGSVILVPGVRLAGFFIDPNVYTGVPVMKLVLPIDRFAPFVEAGAGVGHVSDPSHTGAALHLGGGFMVHPTRSFAIGAEANYQAITGTGFRGFGVGPILALGF
jgi:hypothetical protein